MIPKKSHRIEITMIALNDFREKGDQFDLNANNNNGIRILFGIVHSLVFGIQTKNRTFNFSLLNL